VRTSNSYSYFLYNVNFWSYACRELYSEFKRLFKSLFWSLYYPNKKDFNKAFSIEEDANSLKKKVRADIDNTVLTPEDVVMLNKIEKKSVGMGKKKEVNSQ
jgi:hypothetical protein